MEHPEISDEDTTEVLTSQGIVVMTRKELREYVEKGVW